MIERPGAKAAAIWCTAPGGRYRERKRERESERERESPSRARCRTFRALVRSQNEAGSPGGEERREIYHPVLKVWKERLIYGVYMRRKSISRKRSARDGSCSWNRVEFFIDQSKKEGGHPSRLRHNHYDFDWSKHAVARRPARKLHARWVESKIYIRYRFHAFED